MKHRTLYAVITLLIAPPSLAARAQPVSGFYVGGAGGVTLSQPQSVQTPRSTDDSAASRANAEINAPGPAVEGSAGWGFGNGFRTEAQGYEQGAPSTIVTKGSP